MIVRDRLAALFTEHGVDAEDAEKLASLAEDAGFLRASSTIGRTPQERARFRVEYILAREHGVPLDTLRATAIRLYGHSIMDEREARMTASHGHPMPDRARQARRGSVTRLIRREIMQALMTDTTRTGNP